MLSVKAQTRKYHSIALMLLLLVFLCIALLLAHFDKLKFDNKLEIAGLFTIAGFVVVIFQLWEGNIVQRATFLTEYLTKIYTDEDLNGAFHALVETYGDDLFEQIDAIAQKQQARQTSQQTNAPVFDIFDKFQGARKKKGTGTIIRNVSKGAEEERGECSDWAP